MVGVTCGFVYLAPQLPPLAQGSSEASIKDTPVLPHRGGTTRSANQNLPWDFPLAVRGCGSPFRGQDSGCDWLRDGHLTPASQSEPA